MKVLRTNDPISCKYLTFWKTHVVRITKTTVMFMMSTLRNPRTQIQVCHCGMYTYPYDLHVEQPFDVSRKISPLRELAELAFSTSNHLLLCRQSLLAMWHLVIVIAQRLPADSGRGIAYGFYVFFRCWIPGHVFEKLARFGASCFHNKSYVNAGGEYAGNDVIDVIVRLLFQVFRLIMVLSWPDYEANADQESEVTNDWECCSAYRSNTEMAGVHRVVFFLGKYIVIRIHWRPSLVQVFYLHI